MFNSKSFDLVAEEKKQKEREQLYKPRRMRWLHYIALPALVGFAIMLILVNIDFSSDWNGGQEARSRSRSLNLEQTRASFFCYETDDSRCNLTCDGDLKNNLRKELEAQQSFCHASLSVRLRNCYFVGGNLDRDLFRGDFRLSHLEITDCDLVYIENEAFQHDSCKDLQTLSFVHTKFITLNRKTFNGLSNLRKFVLINLQSNRYAFKGNDFLQPLASTLINVTILQLSNYNKTITTTTAVYEPIQWFGNSTFQDLKHLNLESNNFGGVLNVNTFRKMPDLRYLNLANCSLRALDVAVFEGNWPSLQELDLSYNKLTTLSEDFVIYANLNNVHLVLNFNEWHCGCENEKLIEYIKREQIIEMPKCFTPLDLQNVTMNVIDLSCQGESTTLLMPEEVGMTEATEESKESEIEMEISRMPPTLPTPPLKSTIDPELSVPSTEEEDDKPTFQHTFTCIDPTDHDKTQRLPLDYDAIIQITDHSTNSVLISLLRAFHGSWLLFYLENQIPEVANQGIQVGNRSLVLIDELTCHRIYLFCLVVGDNARKTSPLNCRAHRLPICQITWYHKYQVLIFSLGSVGILIFFVMGVFLIYALLRKRPDWLCGSKRLVRSSRNSHKMLLLPKDGKKETLISELTYGTAHMNSRSNLNPEHNYDDISFYHEIEKTKIYKSTQMPPLEEAPPTPSNSTGGSCSSNSFSDRVHSAIVEVNVTYEELI